MEVAEVGDKVLEELEAIQIRLGRVILGTSNRIGGETILWELGWLPISKWIVAKKVGFYWRMRGIESNRCSRVIFEDRQNEGWVLRVRALMQVNEMGDDGKFSENNLMLQKLREETMNIWVEDMNERVEGKQNGDVSWRRVYRWRLSWRQEEELVKCIRPSCNQCSWMFEISKLLQGLYVRACAYACMCVCILDVHVHMNACVHARICI